jgi:hypothetical protein
MFAAFPIHGWLSSPLRCGGAPGHTLCSLAVDGQRTHLDVGSERRETRRAAGSRAIRLVARRHFSGPRSEGVF